MLDMFTMLFLGTDSDYHRLSHIAIITSHRLVVIARA